MRRAGKPGGSRPAGTGPPTWPPIRRARLAGLVVPVSRITSLRSFLIRAEGGTGRLSTLAFAAGIVGYGLQVVSQAPQVTLTLPGQADRQPESPRCSPTSGTRW